MMLNLLKPVVGASLFIPHGHCYLWKPDLVGLHILSDGLIALAYYSIPLALFYFVHRRRDLPFTWVFLLFSAFIIACGTTHLMEIWTLWHPTYWLSGILKLITAAISLTTAVALVPIVPKALALPSPAQLEAANQALQGEIAERKQFESSLSRLAAIVESSGDAIIGKSLEGVITTWNAGAEKLFGYTAAEVIGRPISLLIPTDHADELPQVLEQIKQGKIIERYDTVRVRKDGQQIQIAATISPIKDAAGQVVGAAKIARDMTQRKQAEQALQESENRFQAFMNNSPAASWITDADGQILYLSQTYSRLFQVPSEAIGKSIFELFPPEIAAQFHRNIRQVVETGQAVEAIELAPCPDGTIGKFLVYKFPLCELSGQCAVGGIAVDVTERERVKEQLRSLNERLQYLLTHAPVAIFSCRAGGDYGATSMSENVRTILGYAPQAFLEDTGFWAAHIYPEDRDRILANAAQIFVTGYHAHEYRFLHGDGQYRWVYNQLQLMRDEADNPTEIIGYLVDISDRKQVEESLQRYERIVSATTDAILLLDRNHVYQVVNQAYLNWYDKQQDEILGHSVSELLPIDVYETIVKPQLDHCLAGHVVQYEMWNEYPVLGQQFLSITYDPYFDAHQTISGVVVSLRNITKLKQAELELELQSIIVRNMAEGVCMVKVSDGIFVYANPKFERMFGYDPGELIGQHVAIVNFEDRNTSTTEIFETLARAILEQGEATYEVRNARKDGTSFWCRATTSVFEHPNYGNVFVVVQQDITERKQVEDQLRDLSNRLTLALKSGAIGTWDWDVTANKLTWDDRMYKLYGITRNQFTNVYEAWANSLYPDDRPLTEAAIQQALAGEKDYEPEFRVRHPDGSIHYLKAYAQVERNQAGAPHRMIGINYDITALKQTAEQIEASLKEKEVLLKEIHHRVKNNLGVIDGLLQMQSRRSQNPEVVATLKESQNRIASIALVHEKLYRSEDLAKIDFSQYIADLTAHLFDSYNVYANQITLTTHIDPISLDVDTAIPCGLIINELVSNALKYAFSNAQTGEIQVSLHHHPDDTLTLIVQDNGDGLPQDFNLKQTKTLGMTLINGLIKQLRGTLEVRTQPGATFVISLSRV